MADHGRDQELGVSDNETNKGPSEPPANQPTKKQLKKRKTGAEQILEEIVAKSSTSATPIPSKSISLYPLQTANTSNGSQDSQKGISFKSLEVFCTSLPRASLPTDTTSRDSRITGPEGESSPLHILMEKVCDLDELQGGENNDDIDSSVDGDSSVNRDDTKVLSTRFEGSRGVQRWTSTKLGNFILRNPMMLERHQMPMRVDGGQLLDFDDRAVS
jgi:hypothetical protein